MKLSVSLPDEDVAFLDSYVQAKRMGSRSAALHRAVALLRASQLEQAYEEAWASWTASGDAQAWDAVTDDGLAS